MFPERRGVQFGSSPTVRLPVRVGNGTSYPPLRQTFRSRESLVTGA